jgi:hypothetical protein
MITALPCPQCGYLCRMPLNLRHDSAVCRQCGHSFSVKPSSPTPSAWQLVVQRWYGVAWLVLALVLAVPAAWAIADAGGDVSKALHGGPERDMARYSLLGAAATAAVGGLLLVRPVKGWGRWIMSLF